MEAVANWLWQGTVVAIAAAILVRTRRSLGATARYRLWWAAMAIVLALPAAPALAALMGSAAVPADALQHGAPARPQPVQLRIDAPGWAAAVLTSVWAVWVAVSVARVGAALIGLRGARRRARPFPAVRAARLEHWTAVSNRGRRASLVLSDDVRYAAVLGGRRPAIAVSPAVAAALDDRDLDRIVVHEWAHVQRHDDRARLLQLLVRAVAGLHPAVWWLDRQIHVDRETACDDWAVNLTGSAKSYAASLTRLAATGRRIREDILQPAAITSSELTMRVTRLLDDRRTTSTHRRDRACAAVVPALCAAAFIVAGVPLIAIGPGAALTSHPVQPSSAAGAIATPAVGEIGTAAAPPPPASPPARRSQQEATATRADGRASSVMAAAPDPAPAPFSPAMTAPDAAHSRPPEVPADMTRDLNVNSPRELPGAVTPLAGLPLTPLDPPLAETAPEAAPTTPWGAAAGAGVNVGRGSQKAAVATAGFFSKLGKSIARSF